MAPTRHHPGIAQSHVRSLSVAFCRASAPHAAACTRSRAEHRACGVRSHPAALGLRLTLGGSLAFEWISMIRSAAASRRRSGSVFHQDPLVHDGVESHRPAVAPLRRWKLAVAHTPLRLEDPQTGILIRSQGEIEHS